jgi:hypothetical protein
VIQQDPTAFSDSTDYGPDNEILASAGMVSSGGFIGDQYHQKRSKQQMWRHLIATPIGVGEKKIKKIMESAWKPQKLAPVGGNNSTKIS